MTEAKTTAISPRSARNRDDEPMSENLVSFAKQISQVTPYWLLQQLAAIDAILIFRFADQIAHIGYDIPTERVPRDEYLCRLFNEAPEDFKLAYIAELWDLVDLPRNECSISRGNPGSLVSYFFVGIPKWLRRRSGLYRFSPRITRQDSRYCRIRFSAAHSAHHA